MSFAIQTALLRAILRANPFGSLPRQGRIGVGFGRFAPSRFAPVER